jgi:hypothetical protein
MWQFLQAQAVIMLALIHGTVVVIAGALIAGRLRKRQFLGAVGGGPVVDPGDRALAGQVGGERNGLPEAEGARAIPVRSAPAQPAAMAVALAARTNAVAPPTTTALLVWAGLAMPFHAPQQRSCRLDSTQQSRCPAHRPIWA